MEAFIYHPTLILLAVVKFGTTDYSRSFHRCHRDSQFLLEGGRSESAFILAVLAAEELAKGVIVRWNDDLGTHYPTRNHKLKQAAFGALCSSAAFQNRITSWAHENGFVLGREEDTDAEMWPRSESLSDQSELMNHLAASDELKSLFQTHSTFIKGTLEKLKHGLLYGDFGVENHQDFENADYEPSVSRVLNDIHSIRTQLGSPYRDLYLVLSHSLFARWILQKPSRE